MALVFFGPRKLPQLSRSLGKSMAEFRRASEDFKRTWDREVNEEVKAMVAIDEPAQGLPQDSILAPAVVGQPLQQPTIEAVSPDRVIPRQAIQNNDPDPSSVDFAEPTSGQSEPARKRDWL